MTETISKLLQVGGRTYAEEAGIRLADKPAPLVLNVLLCAGRGKRVGLPAKPRQLADQVSGEEQAPLAAALVRGQSSSARRAASAAWSRRAATPAISGRSPRRRRSPARWGCRS